MFIVVAEQSCTDPRPFSAKGLRSRENRIRPKGYFIPHDIMCQEYLRGWELILFSSAAQGPCWASVRGW